MSGHGIGLFMADIALIIVCARLAGAVALRLGQPPVIVKVVAGILLGPTLLGTLVTAALFPTDVRAALVSLADLGLQAGLLDARLYSLMIVMALVTTAMTGPLLDVFRADRVTLRAPRATAQPRQPHELRKGV